MNVSKRITTIVNEIKFKTLADIGTDHGYIPIYACKISKIDTAIACDINEAPLLNAKSNIFSHNIEMYIQTRLGSGLTPLKKGEAQTCSIAGMGGDLILNILEDSIDITQSFSQLILQPQSKIDKVRKYIHDIGFRIVNENLINEHSKYYTTISCIKGQEEKYTAIEYALGKILIEKKEPDFINYVQKEKNKLELILSSIDENDTNIEKIKELNMYLDICKEVL